MAMSDEHKQQVIQTVAAYRDEAERARTERDRKNDKNYDSYHMRHDFSHKKAGQSKEFLPKQAMAVEQLTSFMQQGLVSMDEWFSLRPKLGVKKPIMSKAEARILMQHYLERARFFPFVGDSIKSALLGGLAIAKVDGAWEETPVFFTETMPNGTVALKRKKKRAWRPRVSLIRQKDFFPDPTGEGLYVMQRVEMDFWKLKEMAEKNPEVWDMEAVEAVGQGALAGKTEQEHQKSRETGQTAVEGTLRKRVELLEVWGRILGPDGSVLFENHQAVVANGQHLVMPPRPNPFWHGRLPYVSAPLIRVPWSVWHKALMDAPTLLNAASIELYNLILDSAIMSVFGVRQLRPHWLENIEDVSNGIPPGTTLQANMQCPPGQKVLERVDTGTLSQEALNVLNQTNRELQASSLTNDPRMGVLAERNVKATEIVESSQSITSVLTGVAQNYESDFLKPLLELVWLTTMQHADDLAKPELEALLPKDKGKELASLRPQKRFEQTADGFDFSVFGLTQTMGQIGDFRRNQQFLQFVSSSEVLMEEFAKMYDFGKLIKETARALGVKEERIVIEEEDKVLTGEGEREDAEAIAAGAGGVAGIPAGPQGGTQVSQIGAAQGGEAAPIPRGEFPTGAMAPGGGEQP